MNRRQELDERLRKMRPDQINRQRMAYNYWLSMRPRLDTSPHTLQEPHRPKPAEILQRGAAPHPGWSAPQSLTMH